MSSNSKKIHGYSGRNPFKDHQARTFNGEKLIKEFHPTSIFWSLFNDQHEVLIGRRGSGKTILLKMMRYSLLKEINDDRAKKIVSDKKYIGIFAPTHLEFLSEFIHKDISENSKLVFFQFAFNCLLSRSFLNEINAIICENDDVVEQALMSRKVSKLISSVWFPEIDNSKIHSIENIENQIISIYENLDLNDVEINAPKVLANNICRPIQSVSPLIYKTLGLKTEPTWIVCIDEAEFLTIILQRCINSLFRSDSRNIVIKMATLPFHHLTDETLIEGIYAESNGNDFSYRKIDMNTESDDFLNVTNSLTQSRLNNIEIEDQKFPEDILLEDFIGKVGDDDFVDYFKLETKNDPEYKLEIYDQIITSLSIKRQANFNSKNDTRKSHYDKFSTIYFTREMYKISKRGNRSPGWFAGSRMIRKLSEGNPRIFIRIMNVLFEQARFGELNSKTQHKAIYKFMEQECEGTKSLPIYGPDLHRILNGFSEQLHEKVHGDPMTFVGNSFKLNLKDESTSTELLKCLKAGIARSRLNVDSTSYLDRLSANTKFSLSSSFSVLYWIPMRKGDYPILYIPPKQLNFKFGEKTC